jgi:hypothetical protein
VLVMPAQSRQYARGRLAMLALLLVLDLVGVLTQPLLAPLLWPAIPLAVIGFWPAPPAQVGLADQLDGGGSSGRSRGRKRG